LTCHDLLNGNEKVAIIKKIQKRWIISDCLISPLQQESQAEQTYAGDGVIRLINRLIIA
jgi:hypothetical protein